MKTEVSVAGALEQSVPELLDSCMVTWPLVAAKLSAIDALLIESELADENEALSSAATLVGQAIDEFGALVARIDEARLKVQCAAQ